MKLDQLMKKNFEGLFLRKNPDSYIVASESNYQMLNRKTITKDVNKIMRSVFENLYDQPNITSPNF